MNFFILFSVIMMVLGACVLGSDANGCLEVCTADYRPVCAGNGRDAPKTFSNRCALDVHNCRKPQHQKLSVIKNVAC